MLLTTAPPAPFGTSDRRSVEVRVRGRVQGVGFRPTVWRHARDLGLAGEVLNDTEGVLIRVAGPEAALEVFLARIENQPPPLAAIAGIETRAFAGELPAAFRIAETVGGGAHTEVTPDAAICAACAAETLNPAERRFRYPFTNCTHCGPRLSIVEGIPYDRARTTMAAFPLCADCGAEYDAPDDRRFHAEAIACPACGPAARLVRFDGGPVEAGGAQDAVAAAARLLAAGEIVAVKGLGGYQLACDARNAGAVDRLRRLKRRAGKPFALMARDLEVVGQYCEISAAERRELTSARAPIVLLRARTGGRLPEGVAPGLDMLGFMLPTTPLHLLLLKDTGAPLVMTSGNVSDEPQITADEAARDHLAGIARYALVHDRPIAGRVDDSVVRMMAGRVRVLRRARGFAPAPIRLPQGFEAAPEILALGGELKATFCLVKDGQAVLSQHQGDLEHAAARDDYIANLDLYGRLFAHVPVALAADMHPEYLSAKLARARAAREALPLVEVQHHHAHIAACLAENGYPLGAPPVLGIALDGLGWGADGGIWGGEFLLADYAGFERLARFRPVAMPGGAQAVREPWRNLYAQLQSAGAWDGVAVPGELTSALAARPLATLDAMQARGLNSPDASSCGRLFDAVAAALGICRDRQAYEGEAAARLEAIAARAGDASGDGYPFGIVPEADSPLLSLEPAPMWRALLGELGAGAPAPVIAARFHDGLAAGIAAMARRLARPAAKQPPRFHSVALSGGCFQNRRLLEAVLRRLGADGFAVLSHAEVPAGDGGLALGQAAVAAARLVGG